MLKNTNNFNYMFARLISVAYKPLILAYLSFFSTKTILNEFAIVFLFSTLATIGSGFSTYRDFYLHKFSAKKIKIKEINEAFSKYLNSLIVTTIGITIIFFFLAINNIFSLKLYVPIILIFLIEKIWDEVQRYAIVKKKISFWSIFTIAKTIISFISLLISATQTSFSLLLFWSVLNFILVAIFYMFLIYRINIDLFLFKFNLVAGFEYAARHIRFLIIGVIINSFGYLDRIISYFFLLNNIFGTAIISAFFFYN